MQIQHTKKGPEEHMQHTNTKYCSPEVQNRKTKRKHKTKTCKMGKKETQKKKTVVFVLRCRLNIQRYKPTALRSKTQK